VQPPVHYFLVTLDGLEDFARCQIRDRRQRPELRDELRQRLPFAFGERVTAVRTARGRIEAIETTRRRIVAERLVVAAGAWAGEVAALAGSTGIAIEPRRRHLFRGGIDRPEGRSWPFVWNEEKGVYFRPEGDGMLLSPCDAEPHPAAEPEVDPARKDELASKIADAFGVHVPKGYIYAAMGFSIFVEALNMAHRRRAKPVHLRQAYAEMADNPSSPPK